jgi:hypothetical protein
MQRIGRTCQHPDLCYIDQFPDEVSSSHSKTIHRLLDYSPKKAGFQKDDEHSLDCDLLIVNEFPMADCILMHYLLKAVPFAGTRSAERDQHYEFSAPSASLR